MLTVVIGELFFQLFLFKHQFRRQLERNRRYWQHTVFRCFFEMIQPTIHLQSYPSCRLALQLPLTGHLASHCCLSFHLALSCALAFQLVLLCRLSLHFALSYPQCLIIETQVFIRLIKDRNHNLAQYFSIFHIFLIYSWALIATLNHKFV